MVTRRKQKDARRNEKVKAERRRHMQSILETLGVWDRLRSTSLADRLLKCHYPKITVSLDDSVPPTDETTAILKALETVVNRATAPYPPFGDAFPIADLISFVLPLMKVFQATYTSDSALAPFIAEAKKKLDPDSSSHLIALAVHNMYRHLDNELARYCRIDTRLYYLKLHYSWNEHHKLVVRFAVHQEPIRKRMVTAEKGPRPAHWCGQPFGHRGIDWVEWPSSLLGQNDNGPPLPVFVQGHALDDMYRRPDRARLRFIEDGDWVVHDYLWQSLRQPVIKPFPRQQGKFLVEYRLNMHKLGYLLVRRVDDIVLVETFLFLTMDGTPEGDALWRKLRLARPDKQVLELDKIHTFLLTDVQFDRELVRILEECGCGHLFRVVKELPRDRCVPGYAEEMRKYLRLDD